MGCFAQEFNAEAEGMNSFLKCLQRVAQVNCGFVSEQNLPLILHLEPETFPLAGALRSLWDLLEQEPDREIWDLPGVHSLFLFQKLQPLCPGPSVHPHGLSQPPKGSAAHGVGIPAGNSLPVCQGFVGTGNSLPQHLPGPWHSHTDSCSCWASSSSLPKPSWDGKNAEHCRKNLGTRIKESKSRDCPVTLGS